MSRPVQPLGTYGSISVRKLGSKYAATTRFRDMDGDYLRIQATGTSETKATNALKAKIAEQAGMAGDSDLDRNTSLRDLASYWLDEVRVTGRQAPQTLDAYEGSVRSFVYGASA